MKPLTAALRACATFSARILTAVPLAVLLATAAAAQSSTDGSTPSGFAPGSPAGSYALSDFDTVNLYNGSLNIRLPLLDVGGRGYAGYPITLHVEKKWTVYKHFEPGVGNFFYADAGWWSQENSGWSLFSAGKVDIRSAWREQPPAFPSIRLRASPSQRRTGRSMSCATRRRTANPSRRRAAATTGAGSLSPPTAPRPPSTRTWTSSTTLASGRASTTTGPTATCCSRTARASASTPLGRLRQVYEDPGGLNYLTSYTYDALDKLVTVTQGTQTRTFAYDSLSRLTSVTSPEGGTLGYTYDSNGNVLTRTDARGVTATYGYDALNRNTAVSYSDGTMGVGRAYDNNSDNGRGRLSSDWTCEANGCGSLNSYNYDSMGRAYNRNQYFWAGGAWSQPYSTFYGYDLAGNVAAMTYPSGHTVSYSYDAAGRHGDNGTAKTFSGNLGDGAQRTYASAVRYAEAGGMEQERFGTDTPVYNKHLYNSRGQLAEIRVGLYPVNDPDPTRATSWDRGAIINHYSLAEDAWGATGGGPDNNGNLRKQDIYIPDGSGGWAQSTQFFDYDALNRLYQARESYGGETPWVQYFNYDRWGNRTINAANTTGAAPEPQFTVDASTNRLGVPAGQTGSMSYDAAGNLTNDTYQSGLGGGGARTYDAENRMTSAQFVSGQTQTALYAYDGDGRRVKRKAGAGAEVWQVYGVGGELLAEYAANAAPAQSQKEYGYRSGQLLVTADATPATQTNLALGKTATQSSTYPAPNIDASVAVDGVTSGPITHTNLDAQAWWQVDLGAIQQIDSVKLWNRLDCCQDRLSNFYVFVSDSPFTSTDLTTTINQSGVSNYYVAGQAPLTLSQAVGRTGRYVRVQLTGANYLSLREVEVFGSPNLAAGKAAAQSSTYPAPGIDASSAVDGNAGNITHTNMEWHPWWQVDLGSVQSLNAVKLWNRADCCQQRLSNFYILVSDAPFQSGDLNATLAQAGVTAYYVSGQAPAVLTQAVGRTGRYVRVQLGGTDYLSLAEVQVLGAGGGAADVRWLVADQLGTPRMVVDKSGSLVGVKRHDYLPFGEEVASDANLRTAARGYSGDNLRQKFTGYERDAETGLDFALARYFASAQGRFASVDPLLIDEKRLTDPQLLNLYAYSRNNPLKYTDPTGMDVPLEGTQQADYITSFNNRDGAKFKVANIGNTVRIVDDKGKALDKSALKALGNSLSGGEKELFNAITDEKVHTTIDTGNGQPNDSVDFGSNDAVGGGAQGRNTLDMPEMKMLDSPANKGGMSSGNAVAHETLEAYASAQGKSFQDAHDYATKYFGEFQFAGSRVTGQYDSKVGFQTGEIDLLAVNPNGSTAQTRLTVSFPKGFKPGDPSNTPRRITKLEIIR